MAISRMQEPQQIQSGIGSLQDPRQKYFLGKLVKKATRAVKKVAKSPIGKMALIAGAGMIPFGASGASLFSRLGASGLGKGLGGFLKGGMGNFMGGTKGTMMGGLSNIFRVGGEQGADFSTGRLLAGGLGAAAIASPFLMGGDEEVEEVETMDPALQTQRAKNYYSGAGEAGAGLDFMPKKKYVLQNFYAADGGRAMLNMGGGAGDAQAEQMLMMEYVKYKNKGGNLSFEQFVKAVLQSQQAPEGAGMEQPEAVQMAANGGLMTEVPGYGKEPGTNQFDYPSGGDEVRVGKQEGGIMEDEASEMIDMGGMEKDYRNEGGFVAMGGKERADDVPARLSKNEFVFTADAVRNAGGGNIDKGAEVMENLMNNLEQGGEVSEESQGLEGAQAMYEQQQMLQSRII